MMKILIGDLFASQAQTIVNTVNCVGVMGKGIAQIFKQRFPTMFNDYVQRCRSGLVNSGIPYLYTDITGTSILNFPTKNHWRSPSKLDDIIVGIDFFIANYKKWNIKSIAFPPLGCGNGGLEWSIVGPIMYKRLSVLDIPVEIYAPYGTPQYQLTTEFLSQEVNNKNFITGYKQKKINPNWLGLLEIVNQLQQQPYANPVGRTIFQKISYIFTEQGVETGFCFKQGSYGPFSNEVKEALSVLANANLLYEQQLGRMTALRIGTEYQNVKFQYDEQIKQLDRKINKTVDLFSRIKSTEQAEEVTTVLYAARQLKKNNKDLSVSEQDVYDYILNWKKDWKCKEKQTAVTLTIRNLEMLEWLRLSYSESLPMNHF